MSPDSPVSHMKLLRPVFCFLFQGTEEPEFELADCPEPHQLQERHRPVHQRPGGREGGELGGGQG